MWLGRTLAFWGYSIVFVRHPDLLTRGFSLVLLVISLAMPVLALWLLCAAIVKRLHDLDTDGGLALVSLPLGYLLLFIPFIVVGSLGGTIGSNRFGDDPSPTREPATVDSWGKLLDSRWLSFHGRISRKDYWIAFFVAHLSIWWATIPAYWAYSNAIDRNPDPQTTGIGLALLVIALAMLVLALWVFCAAGVKRLHDLDTDGGLALLFLPLGYLLLFLPFIVLGSLGGALGSNQFGDSPEEGC